METTKLLLPDFGVLFLGVLVRRYMRLGDEFWNGLEKLVFFVLFPLMLFYSISRTTFNFTTALPLIVAVYLVLICGMGLALLPRYWIASPLRFSSLFQCGFRYNSYIGFSAAAALYGVQGVATMGLIIGVTIPLVNVVSVWMFVRHGEAKVLREIFRNPLIWGTLSGLFASVMGLHPSPLLSRFFQHTSEASVTLGLLAVGAALRIKGEAYIPKISEYYLILKLILLPLLALGAGWLFKLDLLSMQVMVLFAALPVATSTYIMAMRMQGEGPSVAWLISSSTLLSMLTMPLWRTVLHWVYPN